ncbi:pepsin-like aspartyl protease [Shewanella sp. UCD-KL12]|uniref:pepsin-like aspartyl protease n=1 Tax=Shewanella sp. UCD-KL12 TaxID=1917163 RepID=UPI0009704363|nr:pepsin-like aspartyl protease [Shewanella sp. UCD-KL12]
MISDVQQDSTMQDPKSSQQQDLTKPLPRTLKVPITNVYAMGGYCAQLRIGANKEPVNLILDTGSSTLVVSSSDYVEEDDSALVATSFAQEVLYGAGGWDGPVIHTRVGIREELEKDSQLETLATSNQPIVLESCPVAIVSSIAQEGTFLDADGILGLAYHQLNKSYDLKGYFEQYDITPALTYPWPFDDEISICETSYQPTIHEPALSGSDESALSDSSETALSGTNKESSNSCNDRFTSHDLSKFKKFLKQQPTQDIVPYFTDLTQQGLTANKFAFYSRRSSVHVSSSAIETPTSASGDAQQQESSERKNTFEQSEPIKQSEPLKQFEKLAQDPLNQGWLILGGGEEHTELYQGEFQTISVVEDKYYNVNLIAIQVGDQPEVDSQLTDQLEQELALNQESKQEHNRSKEEDLHDHALLTAIGMNKEMRGRSNAIVDTGVSGIVLTKYLYNAMLESFNAINPKFAELIAPFKQIAQQYKGIDQSQLDLSEWPTLTFSFLGETHRNPDSNESACGGLYKKVNITIKPEHYWQTNTPSEGKACFKILSQLPGWPNQSLLGLPLMNDYFVVFDRSAHETGVIRFAKRK